ncbi:MAG: periplasmic heavy metal sensor [Bacteroidales bacterium]|nr:periplasmic heavy metal sensor [Bacteroidales bacterium]
MKNTKNNTSYINSKVLLGLVIIFATSFTLSAQPYKGKQCPKQGMENKHRGPLAGIPSVTEEQKAEVKELFLEHKKQAQITRLDLEQKRLDLKKLTMTDKSNSKAIDTKIDEIFALKASQAKLRNKLHNDIRNVLNDEQKAVFDMKVQRHAHHLKKGKRMAHATHGKHKHKAKRMQPGK